jgi:hypothetical protein
MTKQTILTDADKAAIASAKAFTVQNPDRARRIQEGRPPDAANRYWQRTKGDERDRQVTRYENRHVTPRTDADRQNRACFRAEDLAP